MKFAAGLAILALFVSTASVSAGEVSVKGTHLCCGACVSAVDEALSDVEGVSKVSADRDSKRVTFTATDAAAAQRGIEALAAAGFYGTASHGGKELAFPASGAKAGGKYDKVVLSGVHLCCGACVNGAKDAVDTVTGVEDIQIDRNAGTVILSGKDITATEAVKALNDGGFYAKYGAPAKK